MAMTRRDFAHGASAAALLAGTGAWEAASAPRGGLIGPYPAPAYAPSPPGTAWFAPRIPAYPQPIPHERLIADAQRLSDALEAHIRAWAEGRASAVLAEQVLPPGWHKRDYPSWRLVRAEDSRPTDQWPTRPAHAIARETLLGGFPDPNCTYLAAPVYAPFGAKLVVAGEFPHARFFDIQMTPSFDPRSYRYDGWAGVGEAPIVDADIEPLPGHANPYRVGARRDGGRRRYQVSFDLRIGDPVALNEAFRPPFFRGPGNTRVGGAILYQGPYGDPRGQGHKRGRWDHGSIWIRYYRPDLDKGPLGGVDLPAMALELEGVAPFWVQADWSGLVARINRRTKPRATSLEPTPISGPQAGWTKQAGILRAIYSGFAIETKWGSKAYVRQFDRGAAARGDDLAPPNNYEQSATSCTYIDYLVRGMQCAAGKVVVLTGRLPTTPKTKTGDQVMTAAQARYWSLTGYVVPEGWDMLAAVTDPNYPAGLAAHSVMDEDIVLQDDRWYVIALSRPQDRPVNAAPEAGVTWADWGLAGNVSWTLRWMSVGPEWWDPKAPTPSVLGRRAEWAEEGFDPGVLPNGHGGAIGAFLPQVHYLSRSAFEALGPKVAARAVPVWR